MRKLNLLTKEEIENRFTSGRGVGRGSDYKPWIRIQEISSDGTSYRVLSQTSGRVVHLLSKLEFLAFSLFDWNENVCDIREQYPFDLETSLEVAKKAGIKHPQRGNKYHVFSTDLLIDEDRYEKKRTAIQVKYIKDLLDQNVIAQLEIERRCCLAKGIDWKLITDLDIPKVQQANVDWILGGKDLNLEANFQDKVAFLWEELRSFPSLPLAQACSQYDKRHNQQIGDSLRVVRNAFSYRQLTFDIRIPSQKLTCGDVVNNSQTLRNGELYALG